MFSRIDPHVASWYLAGIDDAGLRGIKAEELAERLAGVLPAGRRQLHASVAAALAAARAASAVDERVLVFGSFHTVADAMRANVAESERL